MAFGAHCPELRFQGHPEGEQKRRRLADKLGFVILVSCSLVTHCGLGHLKAHTCNQIQDRDLPKNPDNVLNSHSILEKTHAWFMVASYVAIQQRVALIGCMGLHVDSGS